MTQRTRILELHAEGLNIIAIAGRMNLSRWFVRKVLDETPNKASPLHRCLKCQHAWPVSSRSKKPLMCPACKNRAWQRPKKPPSDKPKREPRPAGSSLSHTPTPEEIAAKCAEFRQQSPRQPVGYPRTEWELPVISCSDAGIVPPGDEGGATDRERFWT